MKKKTVGLICGIVAAAVVVGVIIFFGVRGGKTTSSDETAYVEQVSVLTGTGSVGVTNRYAGVVEAQETWSVQQNPDSTVEKVLVEQGQSVKAGDDLFTYSTEKYEADLSQANIDLQRLQQEAETIDKTITQLETEKKKASAADQANYTIQIQEQNLNKQQKELDIQSKQLDIDKLNDNINNATVKSEIDGVVQKINTQSSSVSYGDSDNAFITIMKTGDVRVKGTVNEQNIWMLSEGTDILVHSRVDDTVWKGSISKIDTENKESNPNNMYYGSSSSDTSSSSYPFYVTLESSEGLLIGQHVYMELDYGQADQRDSSAMMLSEFYIDLTDAEHPFVWADNGKGKLEKRAVTLGEYNADLMEYEILDGLTAEDSIAFPEESLKEGMKTAPMSEMPIETYTGDGTEEYSETYTGDGTEEYSETYSGDGAEEFSETYTGEDSDNAGEVYTDDMMVSGEDGAVG